MARKKYINLKRQMLNSIERSFKGGMDKHSDKRNGGSGSYKVYSQSDRKALVDTSAMFASWLGKNHPDVRYIKDIKTEHVQGFLNSKAKEWSNSTIKTHMSRFNKLDRIFDKNIKDYSKQLTGALVAPVAKNETKLRSVAMTRNDFNKITAKANAGRSHVKTALEIAGRTGLRVSEISKLKGSDYNEKAGVLSIVDSKGKRSRNIFIKEEDKSYFEGLKATFGEGRVCPVQHESLNQALNRCMKDLDLEQDYTEHKTSFHSIRKMVAQELYDELREQGFSQQDAWNDVSHHLGHGDGREDLFKAYITRP